MSRFSYVCVLAATLGVVSCDALKAPAAEYPTLATTPLVFALNGGPAGAPSGIYFLAASAAQVDSRFVFNVALDIDSLGRIVIYPALRVANGLTGAISVGLQPVTGSYDDYTEALKNGYKFDSTLVVPVGQTVAVNVLDQTTCTVYDLGASFYAKLIVDSVNTADRAIYTRVLTDPNCGYVSLTSGIPTK